MPTGSASRRFDEYYRCYPVAMLPGPERENVNHGGKVIMPPSALDKLTRLHITYPMLFEVINGEADTTTHAGVLEFIADEGKIYLPHWVRDYHFSVFAILSRHLCECGDANESLIDDGNTRPLSRRPPSNQIHRSTSRPVREAPTTIFQLPRHFRPESRP